MLVYRWFVIVVHRLLWHSFATFAKMDRLRKNPLRSNTRWIRMTYSDKRIFAYHLTKCICEGQLRLTFTNLNGDAYTNARLRDTLTNNGLRTDTNTSKLTDDVFNDFWASQTCHAARYSYILKGKRNAYSLWILFVSKIYFCVNESVFEMVNIHIWAHCDTFHCKQTMCASRVNGKSDRGNASEIQAVWNNRKNWFF